MSTTDHAAEARELLATGKTDLTAKAQVHATLALAEQQRIANLVTLGAIGGGPLSSDPAYLSRNYLVQEYPEVAAALGIMEEV